MAEQMESTKGPQKLGRSMETLTLARISLVEELRASGRLRPATIVNFNPVQLRMEVGGRIYTVPAANDARRPDDMFLKIEFEGSVHKGSYITFENPQIEVSITGTRVDDGSGEEVGTYQPRAILPIGLAHTIFSHYNNETGQQIAPMGGILIFEGTRHLLMKKETQSILHPVAKRLPNGEYTHATEERDLKGTLAKTFGGQRLYTDRVIEQARGYYANENERGNITNTPHRVFGMFAMQMGWIEKEPWMDASLGGQSQERCGDCGTPRRDPKAYFCSACKTPYDAYKAYMDGRDVNRAHLAGLKGKQLIDVQAEMKRRKELFAD